MIKQCRYALNRLFNLFVIAGVTVFVVVFYLMENINELKDYLPVLGLGLFFMIVPVIFMPYCYSFDNDGVTIHYLVLPKERYLWRNISLISVDYNQAGPSNSTLFDLLFSKVFKIQGDVEGKKRFYMEGHICKSLRTKHLLEKYWDGTIDNFLFETKRVKKNKDKTNKSYSLDEIVPLEREMKALAKQCIAPYHNEIVQFDLELRKRYVFLTSDFIELNSRPLEPYTYTVLVDISRPGETNEDNIWTISVDLLFVRLGRNAYKGVKNKNAMHELEESLTETVESIRNNKIECLNK